MRALHTQDSRYLCGADPFDCLHFWRHEYDYFAMW